MDWKLSIQDVRRMAELEREIGFKFVSYQNDSYIFSKMDGGLVYVLQIYNNGEEVLLYNRNQDFIIENSVLRTIGRVWGFTPKIEEDECINDTPWDFSLDSDSIVKKEEPKKEKKTRKKDVVDKEQYSLEQFF